MANKRRREIANGAPGTPQITDNLSRNTKSEPEPAAETPDPSDDGSPSGYEQLREQRIKENLERMQKLGIVHLSHKLNYSSSSAPSVKRPSRRKTPQEASRRSSRLENEKLGVRLENVVYLSYKPRVRGPRVGLPKVNVPKVSLPKVNLPKAKNKLAKAKKLAKKEAKQRRRGSVLREKGAKGKAEIYTEEDEKLLGSTELSWTLFVDGYGADDGKRIYDPVNGKTCHQCRQKTLGHRTKCCQCRMVQGQFCGDCLYMRYGEHVLEANKNPDWICPVCRGICNCSLCRNAKGWPPTGTMYKKIKLRYKSVAHYLIQTKRAPPETESEDKDHTTTTPDSAKRSLTFKDMEVLADGKELHKKAISGQKLDYTDNESGESKDEKCIGESESISPTHIKEEAVSSSEPNAGFVASREGNSSKKANQDASEERLKTTDKAGENEVISLAQESVYQATENVVSSSEAGENEVISSDEKHAQETVSQATDKAVSSSEPNAGIVDSGTINACKKANRDADEERLKTTDKAGENEFISSDKKPAQETAGFVASRTRNSCKKANADASEERLKTTETGCATKSCRKAKRSSSPNAIQDSIARRLRPRINKA